MGVFSFESETVVAVAPARLFKAYVLDGVNFFPKVIPGMKIEILEGDGGAGTVKNITFAVPHNTHVKHRIDLVDKESLVYNYSIIEGHVLGEDTEKLEFKSKIVPSPDGGSIWKSTATYYTKGDAVITEEKHKAAEERGKGLYKAIEAYLLNNPNEYN
ncbi:major allergen Pru ar 1-like [Tripterygium wilfordii]|uniref:Major allergen Pru ar 1-like n=1 Tax=Tripterygium wilfordii TaxID=458696 RepID=A0A7J7CXD1_TRIWF|nr:major allergen Pru ar 1-like [Tripterygium wilfordii]KAF5738743.1 major allergen Pru ar 1-like [Tripterygium wilfordii]